MQVKYLKNLSVLGTPGGSGGAGRGGPVWCRPGPRGREEPRLRQGQVQPRLVSDGGDNNPSPLSTPPFEGI